MAKKGTNNKTLKGKIVLSYRDSDFCNLFAEKISDTGLEMYTCHSLAEVLDKYTPDTRVVIIDISEGRASTLHSIQFLRESHLAATLPIIVTTTSNDTAFLVEALKIGATDYLVEPFTVDQVFDKMMTLLG